MISVLLIDDHAVMRMGLAALLGTCPEIEVVGDAGDGESGIRKALKARPDVVIMDLAMPEMDGAETTRRLLEKMPEAKVLALTTVGTSDGRSWLVVAILSSRPTAETKHLVMLNSLSCRRACAPRIELSWGS